MNTHVRDNFLETAPAKANSGVGRYFVASGSNAIAERVVVSDAVDTSETTASTSFTDLATSGPAVTTTTGTYAIVAVSASTFVSAASNQTFMGVAVSGATAISAGDSNALSMGTADGSGDVLQASFIYFVSTLTGGSNTFTAKYRTTGGTATFRRRRIVVIPY
jgi:hypothetical protein